MSTQPCIPPGSLNRVPCSFGWGKGGNVTSAGWQITLCDPIWYVSSRSGEACLQTAIRIFTFFTLLARCGKAGSVQASCYSPSVSTRQSAQVPGGLVRRWLWHHRSSETALSTSLPHHQRSPLDRGAVSVAGPIVWNSLPDEPRDDIEDSRFRQSLKTLLFSQY